ncbi:ImmA/IrrE family metallo-endopeptidase [Paenibacillus sp. FA6]|uniref:ImmA/IrrE family metallo-endopeptidase n=1 Tax=Paenibacillus sp. FA6 TaxID=3413029 RepID=UPI003F6560FD
MTALEEFLEDIYLQCNIIEPHQITVDEISHRLNVWVHYMDIRSRALESVAGMHSMFLDGRIPSEEQHLEFLHELCHLLRHAGNQTVLPELFTQAQEDEANLFVMYAAIPFSMFAKLSIPDQRGEAINYIARKFQVTHEFAEQRLDQIQRRELQGLFDAVMNEHALHNEVAATSENLNNGLAIYAYYDPNGNYDAPSQIIVNVDHDLLINQEELLFSPNGPFIQIEKGNIHDFIGKPIFSDDIEFRENHIVLNLRGIAERYRYNARRLVLQFSDIENVMDFEKSYF